MAHMCRALYDFSAKHVDSLTVHQGETFLVLNEANTDNPHWWFVVNGLGQMGYVPKSYVNIVEASDECLMQEIDDLLEVLHSNPSPSQKNRNLLKSLLKVRSSFKKEPLPLETVKKKAPAPPVQPVTENGNIDNEFNGKGISEQSPTESANSPITTQPQSPEADHCFNRISSVVLPVVIQDEEPNVSSSSSVVLPVVLQDEDPNVSSSCSVITSVPILQPQDDDCVVTRDEPNSSDVEDVLKTEVNEKTLDGTENVLLTPETNCVDSNSQVLHTEHTFPPLLVPEIVDHVRTQTHLSYSMSILAVTTALETLSVHLPHLSVLFDNITQELNQLKVAGRTGHVFESRDRERLLSIFHRLWSCKEDSEQRSWPLQEDEAIILNNLNSLKQLLVDADSRVCCEVIQLENYECVHTLVTYYQMEVRRCLRLAVLNVLELMCCLDLKVIEQLLNSVLPTELILDMQNHTPDKDRERFVVSAQSLSYIFSTGQSPPRTVYTHLNVLFISWVLDQLESLLEDLIDEEVANMNLSVLLSVNLHLLRPEDNFILEAVRNRTSTPIALTEKLMLLINREEDPVCLPRSDEMQVPNSVLKLLLDLFSDTICAQHFYVNDIKVLLDIIVRQLTDLPASAKRRQDYLKLSKFIMTNTSYIEHRHQQAGLNSCLEWLLENEEFSPEEKNFAQTLISEFPHYFRFA